MDLEILCFNADTGWDKDKFPQLDSENTLIIAFGTSELEKVKGAFQTLESHYPLAMIIGCSTAGEIIDDELQDNSLVVAVIRFKSVKLIKASAACSEPGLSYAAGERLADQLNCDELQSVFVLSEGLTVNGSQLVEGLSEHLAKDVVITGGLSADGDRFNETWTYGETGLMSGQVVAVGLCGEAVQVTHGSQGGWDIFGVERTITRSSGNVLYELDNQPALALYKQYLGDRADELPASGLLFPLALRDMENHAGKQVVRTILAVDEDNQSITFAGDVPEGHRAQLMRANFDRLIDGAASAAQDCANNGHQGSILSIAISCVGRRLVLGERTEEELESVLEKLPDGVRQIGFYSYGEISPLVSGDCDLHNQTMTLTVISEQ
jgi:hypothetical protein